jgi:xeroderma pigmentosum group C-complementing protein
MQTPIFWTEVFDTATQTWFAIDAMVTVRCYVAEKDLKLLQPRGKLAAAQKLGMGLVVGYGASQNAKDVTMRYAGSVTRLADSVMRSTGTSHTRFDAHRILIPFLRSHMADPAEREEDKLLAFAEKAKPKPDEMPTTLSGFQRHPRYMLEKHLREKEAFKPGAQPVGTFSVGKGAKETEERIFLRKDTVQGKTVENYHKEGRQVRMGEQPLKMIRQRAMTTARIRELQQYELEHGTPMMQPIYSVEQTEYIKPPPIVDGRIPKNAFGNADVFVPSMVPEGAVHLPHKGLSRVAKKFSFDWAEAVVGFEFKKRGAIPVVRGVLVAEEHADTLMKAFEEDEAERVRKQDQKREKAALTRWKKMLAGLRIKARIQAEYGTGGFAAASSAVADGSGSMSGPAVKGKKGKAKAKIAGIKKQDEEHVQERDENDTAFDAKPGVVDSHGGY